VDKLYVRTMQEYLSLASLCSPVYCLWVRPKGASLGQAPALLKDIRLGWKRQGQTL